MKNIYEIRRINARNLARSVGSNAAFARILGRDPAIISRIVGSNPTQNIGYKLARDIEIKLDLPGGWLDTEHRAAPDLPEKLVELEPISPHTITMAPAVTWEQVRKYVKTGGLALNEPNLHYPCPVPCGPDTFVLSVAGDAMRDEYRPGELVFVDPDLPPQDGDDVIALISSGEIILRRLVIESDSFKYLKSLNKRLPDPYIKLDSSFFIVGTVIFSGLPRRLK